MPNGIQTRVTESHIFVINGSTDCPSPDLCDQQRGESYEKYVYRHCRDHQLGEFTSIEDAERNLGLYCLYFFHKFIIGNPKLLPKPFWETHQFISNWTWSVEDLEQGVSFAQRTFELPAADRRRAGDYRRYKQLEVPRKCQKTSTVSKAYATQESLRQYFLFGNIHFRIILTSATSTLTTGLLRSYKAIWARNLNIKRLYGITVTYGKGRNVYTERISLLSRNCKAGMNAIAFRWLSDSDDASGKAAFNFMAAGVQTELVGQRADLYIFDDPASDKNSNTPGKREKIKACFSEQTRQLEHTGRMIVCNTRKHLEDFGGMIQKAPLRDRFHTLHRKAVWVDPRTHEKLFYYPLDGEGEAQLDERNLELLRASMPEHEFSSEYLNEPLDPERALFRREDFQIVPANTAPAEIRYGLGRELTRDEQDDLARQRVEIFGYNHCDPAGKEEQSKRGDDSAIVGWRRDRFGNVYITYLRSGQWASSRLWEELYAAYCYNRPLRTDYEKPSNDLHTLASYQAWVAKKQKDIDDATPKGQPKPSADIRPLFQNVPRSTKPSRIQQMEPLLKSKRLFILDNAAAPEEIEKFVSQFVSYLALDHDDYADCASRMVPILGPQNFADVAKPPAIESDFTVAEGVTSVPFSALLEMNKDKGDGQLWGQKGRSTNAA